MFKLLFHKLFITFRNIIDVWIWTFFLFASTEIVEHTFSKSNIFHRYSQVIVKNKTIFCTITKRLFIYNLFECGFKWFKRHISSMDQLKPRTGRYFKSYYFSKIFLSTYHESFHLHPTISSLRSIDRETHVLSKLNRANRRCFHFLNRLC